jgi:aminopeptidase-like protein
MNEEWWFDNDIKNIVKGNKLANWIVKNIWLINKKGKCRYKGIYILDFICRHRFVTMVCYCSPLTSTSTTKILQGGGRT